MGLFGPDYEGMTQDALNAYQSQAEKARQALESRETQGRTDITGGLSTAQGYSQPYTQAGTSALQSYMGALGLGGSQANLSAIKSFQTSPGYQFALNEGLKGIQRQGAATGLTGSGAQQKELMKYSQGLANQQYGDWENQLKALTGIGQTSAESSAGREMQAGTNLANQGQYYGGQLSNLFQNMGSAESNAILSQMAMEGKNYESLLGLGGSVLGGLTTGLTSLFGNSGGIGGGAGGGTGQFDMNTMGMGSLAVLLAL